MSRIHVWRKDPESTLDYSVNWASWLTSPETIASVAWNVPSGLTEVSTALSGGTATVWISGGTAGQSYTVECKITTNSTPARVDERSFKLIVEER